MELIVVIAIIALLTSILVPMVGSAIALAERARTQSYITALGIGTQRYEAEHEFFPGAGQDRLTLDNGTGTGSQLLAKALFTPKKNPTEFPTNTAYCDFKPSYLATIAGKDDTLSEQVDSNPLAICYYPANKAVGYKGSIAGQYSESHNNHYTNGNTGSEGFFDFIEDDRQIGKPYKSGEFLLIAPGKDRLYFTPDDVTNFLNK